MLIRSKWWRVRSQISSLLNGFLFTFIVWKQNSFIWTNDKNILTLQINILPETHKLDNQLKSDHHDQHRSTVTLTVVSSGRDELSDPARQFGDACINPIIIGPSTSSAPAHHTSQKPAAGRFLTHQRTSGITLTEKQRDCERLTSRTHHSRRSWCSPDTHPSLRCDNRHKSFWEWRRNHRNARRHLHWPIGRLLSAEHHSQLLTHTDIVIKYNSIIIK